MLSNIFKGGVVIMYCKKQAREIGFKEIEFGCGVSILHKDEVFYWWTSDADDGVWEEIPPYLYHALNQYQTELEDRNVK